MFVIVRDTDHFTPSPRISRGCSPWPEFERGSLPFAPTPERHRKPTGEAVFGPPARRRRETHTPSSAGARPARLARSISPHVVRDWYARAWFDLWLKDDAAAREELRGEDPFGELTSVRRDLR